MQFKVERAFWRIFGATVRSWSPDRQLICKAEQKAFKLKEHVVFYADENQTQSLFSIKARTIIDISATYDIFNQNEQVIGSMRRKGLSSIFVKDHWLVLDPAEQTVAEVVEESGFLGFMRRMSNLFSLLVPQMYVVKIGEQQIGSFQQNRNPFTMQLECSYQPEADQTLSKELMLAIPNMLAVIEQKEHAN